ncbi:MAG: hypothetical protein JWM72_872, partial [Actinomycetia bacterium]|nr:hypothetical protein [Actinomycetes bacterium]
LTALAPRGERMRRAIVWLTAVAITGSYWYFRNLIAVGNPLPSQRVSLGPLRLPFVPIQTSAVIHYVFDGSAWRQYLLPGLRDSFGPVWWGLLVIAGTGFILGVLRGPDRVARMVSLVAVAIFIAFLFSPQVLTFAGGPPIFFGINVRYVASALILGGICLAIASTTFGRRSVFALSGTYLSILVATQFDRSIWRGGAAPLARPIEDSVPRWWGVMIGIAVCVTAVAVLIGPFAHSDHTPRRYRGLLILGVVATLIAGYAGDTYYMDHRYADASLIPRIYLWARDVRGARIAVVGTNIQYPLFGKDSSNYVQYLAARHADKTSSRISGCVAWKRAINSGRYGYVLATSPGPIVPPQGPPELAWTRSDPAAQLLLSEPASWVGVQSQSVATAWLFRIVGSMKAPICMKAAKASRRPAPP